MVLVHSSLVMASPSETNILQIIYKNDDAENFKAEQVQQIDREYGPNNSHVMHDYSLGFTKALGADASFVFLLECQQRVLDYQTDEAQVQAPTCSFTYFTQMNETATQTRSIVSDTYIEVEAEYAEKMIQNLSWQEYNNSGWYYFGCFDNVDSGCPNIRFYPATATSNAEAEITYYKP